MTTFHTPNIWVALPEMLILGFACIALLADLFTKRSSNKPSYYIVQLALIGALSLTLPQWESTHFVSFGGSFVIDRLAIVLKSAIYILAFAANWYAREYVKERHLPFGEYYVLSLISVLGMMVLVSANSLLTLYLGLELLSLPLYAMVALQKSRSSASEAAVKYFIMGALASGMLLYGMSMLYGATGALGLPQIAKHIMTMPVDQRLVLSFGMVFLTVGIGFKFAAVPFHMWAPDVYQGAPASVTSFLGSVPKLAAFALLFRLFVTAMPMLHLQWQHLLIILAILSMVIGNFVAIMQVDLKRMLAYSGISQIGYLFLGLIAATPEGYSAALFYVLTYALTALGGLGMIVLLSRNGIEFDKIEDFKGLNQRNPWLAFLMLLLLFSMAGVPPMVGFFAKLFVLNALINAGFVWLAVLALVLAVVGAYYYIRVVKVMYFDTAIDQTPLQTNVSSQAILSLNALAVLALGLFPSVLVHVCQLALG